MTPALAVIGAGAADLRLAERATAVGRAIAEGGALLVCGGLGGVMEAASQGAHERGGTVLGILPGYERSAANRWVDVAVATGMGHARNTVVVASADAVIALAGEAGTLSEIGLARKLGRPVVAVDAWHGLDGVEVFGEPSHAVERALLLAGLSKPHPGVTSKDKHRKEPPS